MIGNVWILLGVIAGAFSLFAIPHGFQLKDKEKQQSGNNEAVGFVSTNKVAVAKLKIVRAFEDFYGNLKEIREKFSKDSDILASQYSVRGVLTSGLFVKAQMDLSINVKRQLDKKYEELKRRIEDILVDNLGVTSLQLAGTDFEGDQLQLYEAQKNYKTFYTVLNNNAKNWEMRAVRQDTITKNFDVANFN